MQYTVSPVGQYGLRPLIVLPTIDAPELIAHKSIIISASLGASFCISVRCALLAASVRLQNKICPGLGPAADFEACGAFSTLRLVGLMAVAGFVTLPGLVELLDFLAFAGFFALPDFAGLGFLLVVFFAAVCMIVSVATGFLPIARVWERVDTMIACGFRDSLA